METRTKTSSALLSFLKSLAANIGEILRNRFQLFAAEAMDGGRQLLKMAILAAGALFSAGMAFILLNVTVVYLFWESAQLTVLISLTVFYTLLLAAIVVGFRLALKRLGGSFSSTIEEFKKDYECLRKRD